MVCASSGKLKDSDMDSTPSTIKDSKEEVCMHSLVLLAIANSLSAILQATLPSLENNEDAPLLASRYMNRFCENVNLKSELPRKDYNVSMESDVYARLMHRQLQCG